MSFNEWIIDRTGGQTMLCLNCTIIFRVGLARYGLYRARNLGTGDCGIPTQCLSRALAPRL